jgi:OmpA-OmpF porin, OOP family
MNRQFKYFVFAILLSALSLGSAPAFSQSQDQGLYAGVNVGKSKFKDICGVPGVTGCDETDTALSIFGGYQFSRNFGAEIAYVELGKAHFVSPGGNSTVESTGFEFSGIGTFPINEKLSLYGKLGFFLWDADLKGPTAVSDDGTDLTFGFGARWNFTKSLAGQVQWQRYDVSDADVDVIGVGVLFRF